MSESKAERMCRRAGALDPKATATIVTADRICNALIGNRTTLTDAIHWYKKSHPKEFTIQDTHP